MAQAAPEIRTSKTRVRIKQVTLSLLSATPPRDLRLRDIAVAAEVSSSLVIAHFASLETAVAEVCVDYLDCVFPRLAGEFLEAVARGGDAAEVAARSVLNFLPWESRCVCFAFDRSGDPSRWRRVARASAVLWTPIIRALSAPTAGEDEVNLRSELAAAHYAWRLNAHDAGALSDGQLFETIRDGLRALTGWKG